MEDQDHIDTSETWRITFSEIKINWRSFNKEIKREWEGQLKNGNSPLQRSIKLVKNPSTIPDPVKGSFREKLTGLKTITDSGLDAVKDLLKRLH